jgi:hypothetical protein
MLICTYCGHNNLEGVLFCEDCGQNLRGNGNIMETLPTRSLEQLGMTNDLRSRATWGTARFSPESAVLLHVADAADPIILQVMERMVLGRTDASNPRKPDLDLSDYGAMEKGVSRMHATLYRSEDTLTIVDMGSMNGTHLNGQRLAPNQPRILRDGDEIRLGKLVAHIYFR